MVSINGSPNPLLPSGSASSADRSAKASSASASANASTAVAPLASSPNAIASAVALSVKERKNADFQQNQVQYDMPQGKSRKALQEYFAVMSQAQREELAQMLGVDMYV